MHQDSCKPHLWPIRSHQLTKHVCLWTSAGSQSTWRESTGRTRNLLTVRSQCWPLGPIYSTNHWCCIIRYIISQTQRASRNVSGCIMFTGFILITECKVLRLFAFSGSPAVGLSLIKYIMLGKVLCLFHPIVSSTKFLRHIFLTASHSLLLAHT